MKHRSRTVYLLIPLILVMVALFLLGGVKLLESLLLPRVNVPSQTVTRRIERDGTIYYPRQDIRVILLTGTDTGGKPEHSGSDNNKASADLVALLIFDEATEEFRILSLNRDTMMNIPVLGINGKDAGTVYARLATGHNYGTGMADSCENTCSAVSDFLYGLTIDHYFCVNMDGICVLNDSVGGVEVRIDEDFSAVDPTLKQGATMVLHGEQAYSFIRSRDGVGSQLNLSRMERQMQYMEGLVASLKASISADKMFFVELRDNISDYVQTDCRAMALYNLATEYSHYRFAGCITLEGETILGDRYYEFYPDLELLDGLILDLFYEPVDS